MGHELRRQPGKETDMKTDSEIRSDVETELQWDPSVDDKKIGVIVSNGVVTLTGEVSHFAEKWAAEDVAKLFFFKQKTAYEIQVKLPLAGVRNDTEIAEAAANALRWHVTTAGYELKPVVTNGWVSL